MAKKFYVVGGEYADTAFTTIASGHKEERFGPFGEQEAHVCWRALTGKTVDNAMIRYFILADEEQAEDQWYVVGGEYADTSFDVIAADSGFLPRPAPLTPLPSFLSASLLFLFRSMGPKA